MTWTMVEGTYKDGQIHLKEEIGYRETLDVIVFIPEPEKPPRRGSSWKKLRQKIALEIPELLTMTEKEKRLEFDQLTAQIAQNISYGSVEEFEQSMRGDQYGLTRY